MLDSADGTKAGSQATWQITCSMQASRLLCAAACPVPGLDSSPPAGQRQRPRLALVPEAVEQFEIPEDDELKTAPAAASSAASTVSLDNPRIAVGQ